MERTPNDTGIDTKDSPTTESKKTSKKKAESFGALLVEKDQPKQNREAIPFFRLNRTAEAKPVNKDSESNQPKADKSDEVLETNEALPKDLTEVSDEEQKYIVLKTVEAAEQHQEQHDDPVEQAADADVAAFHQKIREHEGDLDAALNDMEATELAESEPTEAAQEDAPEQPDEAEPTEIDAIPEAPDDADPAIATPPPAAAQPLQGGGANTPPPRNPAIPAAFAAPGGPGQPNIPNSYAPQAAGWRGNVQPMPTPPAPEVIVDRGNTAGTFLLGGLVGYLIGRRRGRIKTEKKLKPIQKKLEKQVEDLQAKVQTAEFNIRQAAREKARAQRHKAGLKNELKQSATVSVRSESVAPAVTRETIVKQNVTEINTPIISRRETEPTTTREQPSAVAAERAPLTIIEAPSHLGKMIVTAEAAALAKPLAEVAAARASEITKHPDVKPEVAKSIEKKVLLMNRNELLQMAETVVVDGSTLRQIYDTKLVGERGLRRLMEVHLRGGDIKKQLRREVVEREIDFERDPALRDRASIGRAVLNTGATTAQVDSTQQGSVEEKQTEVDFHKAKAEYQEQQHAKEHGKRRILDISLITVIVTLFAFIVVLIMERS